jgi:hypothetical protein
MVVEISTQYNTYVAWPATVVPAAQTASGRTSWTGFFFLILVGRLASWLLSENVYTNARTACVYFYIYKKMSKAKDMGDWALERETQMYL